MHTRLAGPRTKRDYLVTTQRFARRFGSPSWLTALSRGPEEYFAAGPRDFSMRADSPAVTFCTDAAGKVTGLAMYPRGRANTNGLLEAVRVEH
jgi:hypothetical protein